jgi:PPOX class probable F420-dependent enzyme
VPTLDDTAAHGRFVTARVARLATVGADGRPHLVPICFALDGQTLYSAVDGKPKRTTELARLAHIERDPRVTLLADHYEDADWGALWWVRAEGEARVLRSGPEHERALALALLVERYPQYRERTPAGAVIAVAVERWSGWEA